MQTRALTVRFQRAVSGDGPPVIMEVAVNPLATPSSPSQDVTLIGRDSRDVLLADAVTEVVFHLVPTDHPDLTERVPYRIAWREKYMGRQFTSDFVMPDFDVDFDDLQDLGGIIGGTTYVQWSDVGQPNGVAPLNAQGQVLDGEGNIVSGAEAAASVQGNLDSEIVIRQQQDNFLRQYFLQFAEDQITQVYQSTAANLNAAIAQLQNADTTEKAQRQSAVAQLNNALSAVQAAANAQISDLNEWVNELEDSLDLKADLVGGKIPSAQLPDVALGRAVTVASQSAMLALTDVQPGDFAVRPDGIFFLNGTPASTLGNWVQFNVAATVLSVNGHTGAVVLSASDVGARPVGTNIPQSEITGLTSALGLKTDATITNAIDARLAAIEADSTIVRTSGGVVPRTKMGTFMAFINDDGQVTRKDGTVLNLGGEGGDLDIADVTGLQAALDAKVNTGSPQAPAAHKATHATAGSDPLTPGDIGAALASHTHAVSAITGLSTTLDDHADRIDSLETRVEDLELGGGGGGGGTGASGKTVWWSETGIINPLDTSLDEILLRSPFGYDGADYYYDPAGADSADAVWPYLTPNGHLKFIKRNELAPADDPVASQPDLDALSDVVDTKADQADLDTLTGIVNLKATIAALTTLSGVVDTKATITALNSVSDAVSTKASQSAFDTLSTLVGTKAAQSALDTLTTLVGTKAAAADLTALTGVVSGHTTNKANLVSGTVPLAELPNNIPASKITGLNAALVDKADLVSGTVPLTQLPSLPTSKITDLDTTLGAKADLVDGKVPTAQLPNLAFSATYPVANRAAMLALTTGQVQVGDIAVITATVDKGSYILNASDPTVFTNWVKLVAPDDAVQSVNGQSGTVVLDAASVGARSSSAAIPQADITGLTAALGSKVDTTTYTTGLAGKTSPTDVQTITSQAANKQLVDLVSTSNVATLSGSQTIDGQSATPGTRVLLTAQSSSVNNGVWVAASGTWSRATDMATGEYFTKGILTTAGANGSVNKYTVWQQTAGSGVVGTNANNWVKVLIAGPQTVYTATNGVQLNANEFSARVASGGGLQATVGGLRLDPNVALRKVAMDVPAGSSVVTLTHNLGTLDVDLALRDKASGDFVLAGWRVTGINTISVEFKNPPSSGQWRAVITG